MFLLPFIIVVLEAFCLAFHSRIYRFFRSLQHSGHRTKFSKETPLDVKLHVAAVNGDVKKIRHLLETGRVHVDSKDQENTTPLILAAASGHLDAVQELLHQGADITATRHTGTTALFFAAQGGYLEVAKYLLSQGSPVNSISMDGATPLFVACQCGYSDIVDLLLSYKAIVKCQMLDGASPLFIAAQNGHDDIVKILINSGSSLNCRRGDGATALWIASQMGHAYVVRVLLKYGANVDIPRRDGATPLFKACHKGHIAVVAQLLRYNPSLGILPNGESALHAAVLGGHTGVVKLLLEAGSLSTLKNQENVSPIELAFQLGNAAVFNIFSDFDASMSFVE